LVFQYCLLRLVVTERLRTKKQLIENYSHAPNVHFMCYLRTVLLEAFWRLVPVSTDALRCELNLLMPFVDYLAETKVSYLNLSVVKDNVLWLEIIMNNLLFALVQVLKPT